MESLWREIRAPGSGLVVEWPSANMAAASAGLPGDGADQIGDDRSQEFDALIIGSHRIASVVKPPICV